jgi:CRP-like cAMP-binding protein
VNGPTGRARETALTAHTTKPGDNRLLASLSTADMAQLAPSLRTVSLEKGAILNEPGAEIDQVIFPHDGMISLLAVMADGKVVETATIGREGVVGGMAGLCQHVTTTRWMAQMAMTASQVNAATLRRIVAINGPLRDGIIRANELLLAQVQTTAACNALHPIYARLARWILQSADRGGADRVPLTQELLSEMLGVRRSSVSEVAARLQEDGLIRYSRGLIDVLHRRGLEEAACECYGAMKRHEAAFLD